MSDLSLVEYVVSNSKKGIRDKLHQALVDEISRSLTRIGIRRYDLMRPEVEMVGDDGQLVGCVDLVVVADPVLWTIEAKVSRSKGTDRHIKEINHQLRKAYNFFREGFGISPHLIGAVRKQGEHDYTHYEYIPRK